MFKKISLILLCGMSIKNSCAMFGPKKCADKYAQTMLQKRFMSTTHQPGNEDFWERLGQSTETVAMWGALTGAATGGGTCLGVLALNPVAKQGLRDMPLAFTIPAATIGTVTCTAVGGALGGCLGKIYPLTLSVTALAIAAKMRQKN